ncbi:DEKNAAC102018 [Brettanomyces naardenensis]|uniref:DEKNAAC102018 n=1 Tax=Brettanomyces naardenensis TaxID=13370 RepID=A0A448YJJ3_BRENA|nr:DEKNAAC102018 [Brettanomyces naardenensis]
MLTGTGRLTFAGFKPTIRLLHTTPILAADHPQLWQLKDIQRRMETNSDGNNYLIQVMARQRQGQSPVSSEADKLNSLSTLPQLQLIKPRNEILSELEKERPDLEEGSKKSLTILYRILKSYLVFFREGITNVWRTWWDLRRTVYRGKQPYYVFDNGLGRGDKATGSARDKQLVLRPRSLNQVIGELATSVRCQQNVEGEKMWLFEQKDDQEYIGITRKQLQTMIRNKYDAPRLPGFALLFALLEELSILVCWVSPYITPMTCLFPRFMPRYFSRALQAQQKLKKLRNGELFESIASRNPFNMSVEECRSLSEVLMVNESFKWANCLESTDFMRQRLLQRYKEITLDNYLIIRDGGVNQLHPLELFTACLRRGLIDFEGLVRTIKENPDRYYTDFLDETKMRLDLTKFIVDFADRRNNIGLLGLYITAKPVEADG